MTRGPDPKPPRNSRRRSGTPPAGGPLGDAAAAEGGAPRVGERAARPRLWLAASLLAGWLAFLLFLVVGG